MAVQKIEYQVTGKKFTRYIDGLINGAQGVVEMVCLENDVLRAVCVGKFTSSTAANELHIGTMPTGNRPTHHVLYPVLASRTVRDRDAFIQVNPDGKIHIMAAKANTEYTFSIPLPARQ